MKLHTNITTDKSGKIVIQLSVNNKVRIPVKEDMGDDGMGEIISLIKEAYEAGKSGEEFIQSYGGTISLPVGVFKGE